MLFHTERLKHLSKDQPRWAIVNDLGITVATCAWRTWADHVTHLLNAAGRDMEPTPSEQQADEDTDQHIRQQADIEELAATHPRLYQALIEGEPAAKAFRDLAARYMAGEQP